MDRITTINVWALFDEAGAGYRNLAPQVGYWPSLYRLAPPSLDLEPATAEGVLPPVICDNTACTATVSLKPGLTWTDGSAFTAADVVFTINTALEFQLGLDWRQFYNPDALDHAEAPDEHTVKLYFKIHPAGGDWQYGVLQGPIVNRAYWQPRIADAVTQLPDEALLADVQGLETESAEMQAKLDAMNLSLNSMVPGSGDYIETSKQTERLQADLVGTNNSLEKKRTQYEAKLAEARASLYLLDNTGEPSLGAWKFAGRDADWIENQVNLGSPFGDPWFDSVRYISFLDEQAAVDALIDNQVDLILTPNGLSLESVARLEEFPEITLSRNATRSVRFLVFNHITPYLADPVLHRALACLLDPQILTESLDGEAVPMTDFVLEDFWKNSNATLPCAGKTRIARMVEAYTILKSAGYSWEREPSSEGNASGLTAPDGNLLPSFRFLAPQEDPVRKVAAFSIAEQTALLGLSISVELRSYDDLLYQVYGSGDYDMALLGWRLSAYPSYLCDWFPPSGQNPFNYNGNNHRSACDAWAQVSDLNMSRELSFTVQSVLMQDLPLIPLYANVRVDAYRNIRYPFTEVVDGLGGLYGAPGLAIPLP